MTFRYEGNDVADYLSRMSGCRQFSMFRVQPRWTPGTGDIEGFCHDEVVRQFHDPNIRRDGGVRIEWMLSAWDYAYRAAADHDTPDTNDILSLGALVEPEQNSTIGFRTMNVYIGNDMGAPPIKLKGFVTSLVAKAPDVKPVTGRVGPHPNDYRAEWGDFEHLVQDIVTADDWYLAYEAIHPFADGNGRTGKILHNWLLGALDEPVLVTDYFGGGNP